jgi:hypothetical protein
MNLDFRSETALAGARTYAAGRHDGHTCADCGFAQLFAVQPGALCTAAGSERAGKHLQLAQRACHCYVPRPAQDTTMAGSLAKNAKGSPVAERRPVEMAKQAQESRKHGSPKRTTWQSRTPDLVK